MRKIIFIAGLVTMSLAGSGYAVAQGMGAAGGPGQGGAGMNSSSGMSSSGGMGSGAGMTSGSVTRATGGMSAGGMRSTSDDTMELRPARSNRGGTMRGADRANSVAGTNGMRGRTNARMRQMTE
jgi:hypothetical protein